MPIPSLLVGDGKVPSGACFKTPGTIEPLAAPSSLQQQGRSQKMVRGGFSALFKTKLTEVGMEASAAEKAVSEFDFAAEGMSIVAVDPARIRANFDNPVCNNADLHYFKERDIVISALKADTLNVAIADRTANNLGANLTAALNEMNTDLDVLFKRNETTGHAISLAGNDLFFGYKSTDMTTSRCQLKEIKFAAGMIYRLCDGDYRLEVNPLTETRYKVTITPAYGTTTEYKEYYGKQVPRVLNQIHVIWFNVNKGTPMTGDFSAVMVGASGDGE
jgi:hypothetical protein